MNYYKRHLGDYAKKAGRLSMLQHGSYTLLIDACYDREEFPTLDQAIEWTWASTTEEVEAVTFVLRKFFTLENGVFVQKRIQEEIDEYYCKAETNRRIAMERETKRREKLTVRAQVVNESAPVQNDSPPNHEPLTTNHKPVVTERTARGSRLPADWVLTEEHIDFCKTERPDLNPESVGAEFSDWWHSAAGSKGVKLDWMATWRNWVRKQNAPQHRVVKTTASFKASDDAKARERWEEMTGRIHPDNMVAPKHGGEVIDITPKTLELSQ